MLAKVLFGILLFLALDTAIFRSGWYRHWVDPVSRTGTVIRAVDSIHHAPEAARPVLVLGDSRIGEGISRPIANTVLMGQRPDLSLVNGAAASSTPRVWYFLLREILQRGRQPAAVAVMTDSYHDDSTEDLAERQMDIGMINGYLGLRDLLDFPLSFHGGKAQFEAAQAILLSATYYKADLIAFAAHPASRIASVQAWRANGFEWVDAYPGRSENLAGLKIDQATGGIHIPEDIAPALRAPIGTYARTILQTGGRPAENAASARYRFEWYGRLAALCRDHGIPLIVFRIPRGPLHSLFGSDSEVTGALAALAGAGMLKLLSGEAFADLEQPDYFFDELHLNAVGRQRFSEALAKILLPILVELR